MRLYVFKSIQIQNVLHDQVCQLSCIFWDSPDYGYDILLPKIIYLSIKMSHIYCIEMYPVTKAIHKVQNVCAYSPHTCFVAADHWFLMFMQLYVGPCHVVSAEITVTMAVPIENPPIVRCEVLYVFCRQKTQAVAWNCSIA